MTIKNNNKTNKIFSETKFFYFYIVLIVLLILLPIIVNVILYFTTSFEKVITVQEKYTRYRKGGSNYNVVDTDNTIYKLDNVWFKGDFNRADEYVQFKIGKKYKVKGFGKRVPFLNMYKKIYEVKLV